MEFSSLHCETRRLAKGQPRVLRKLVGFRTIPTGSRNSKPIQSIGGKRIPGSALHLTGRNQRHASIDQRCDMKAVPNSLFPAIIPTKSLKLSDVPKESDPWRPAIIRFAWTFDPAEDDPYQLDYRDLPTLSADSGLVRLRAHLFLQQRRWNHVSHDPDASDILAIQRVIALIRAILSERSKDVSKG